MINEYILEELGKGLVSEIHAYIRTINLGRNETGGFILGNNRVKWQWGYNIINRKKPDCLGRYRRDWKQILIRERTFTVTRFLKAANVSREIAGENEAAVFQIKHTDYFKEIMREYKETQNKVIGEWHTHPSGVLVPSIEDEITLRKKLRFNRYYILAIAGRRVKNITEPKSKGIILSLEDIRREQKKTHPLPPLKRGKDEYGMRFYLYIGNIKKRKNIKNVYWS